MGIDGIGKPPGAPPPGAAPGAASPSGTGATFRVEQTEATSAVQSGDLERLGRGELSLEDYLNAKVTEATSHLQGKLSLQQLEFVQQTLRTQLETDPVLIELVRQATGKTGGG